MAELFDILNYAFDSQEPGEILTFSPEWTPLSNISLEVVEEGVFELAFSLSFYMADINDDAMFRYSLDGGATWSQFSKEAKDLDDRVPVTYVIVQASLPGSLSIMVEATKSPGGVNMYISGLSAWIKRVA